MKCCSLTNRVKLFRHHDLLLCHYTNISHAFPNHNNLASRGREGAINKSRNWKWPQCGSKSKSDNWAFQDFSFFLKTTLDLNYLLTFRWFKSSIEGLNGVFFPFIFSAWTVRPQRETRFGILFTYCKVYDPFWDETRVDVYIERLLMPFHIRRRFFFKRVAKNTFHETSRNNILNWALESLCLFELENADKGWSFQVKYIRKLSKYAGDQEESDNNHKVWAALKQAKAINFKSLSKARWNGDTSEQCLHE